MTWRRVTVVYLMLAALATHFVLFERVSRTVEPAAKAPTAAHSMLGADPRQVKSVTFRRAGGRVSAIRDDGRWRVVVPSGANITSDLIAAAVSTLTAGQVSEVMAKGEDVDLQAFGLGAPASEIEVVIDGESGTPVRVLLGAYNPTKTALYAKRADESTVYLVGMNLRYYEDLIFEAVAGSD